MKTGYLVTGDGGAAVKQTLRTKKGEPYTDVTVIARGAWLPTWVDMERAEHLVRVGIVEKVDLDRKIITKAETRPFVANTNGLAALLSALDRAGVTGVPGRADYERLLGLGQAMPAPSRPASWLALDNDTAADMVREHSYFLTAKPGTGFDRATSQFVGEVASEFAAVIAAHADDIIDQLRPAFDESANKARALVDMGVQPADTYQTLFDQPDKTRKAWTEFRARWAGPLDAILAARQLLSKHTPTPPQVTSHELAINPPEIDWAIVATHPYQPGALTMQTGTPSYQRWIRAAEHLHLTRIAELDPAALTALETYIPMIHSGMLVTEEPNQGEAQ